MPNLRKFAVLLADSPKISAKFFIEKTEVNVNSAAMPAYIKFYKSITEEWLISY